MPYTGAGAASGGLAAATGGASLAYTAGKFGAGSMTSAVIAATASGGVGGAVNMAIVSGGNTGLREVRSAKVFWLPERVQLEVCMVL